MKIVAIIQARMGSTRLPGKVMKEIVGKPMLWHVIQRVKSSKLIDKVIVATTTSKDDAQIIKLAEENATDSYAGSEEDVLDRFYQATSQFKADVIVRLTADCPLIDPEIVDRAISYFLEGGFDFVHTGLSFPDGVADTDVFAYSVLEKTWKEAKKPSEREHVTPYMHNHPELFRIGVVENNENLSHIRLSVDREEDLTLVRKIYRYLYKPESIFHMKDILRLLKEKPELMEINKGIPRYEGYIKSLKEEKALGSDTSRDMILKASKRIEQEGKN